MVYDVKVYATGKGGELIEEIEILEYPDGEAPKEINNFSESTFRFYNRWEAEDCARNRRR